MENSIQSGQKQLELQELTPRQKVNFIRKKLEQFVPNDSERSEEELNADLIGASTLTWRAPDGKPSRLPPQRGKVIKPIYYKHVVDYKTTMPDGFLVDFTGSTPVTGVDFAVFGVNAFQVTTDGRLFIDCTKTESPKSGIQALLPNWFVDKTK